MSSPGGHLFLDKQVLWGHQEVKAGSFGHRTGVRPVFKAAFMPLTHGGLSPSCQDCCARGTCPRLSLGDGQLVAASGHEGGDPPGCHHCGGSRSSGLLVFHSRKARVSRRVQVEQTCSASEHSVCSEQKDGERPHSWTQHGHHHCQAAWSAAAGPRPRSALTTATATCVLPPRVQGVTPPARGCASAVLQALAGSLTEEGNQNTRAPNGSRRDSLEQLALYLKTYFQPLLPALCV